MMTHTSSSDAAKQGEKCILVVEDDVTISDLLAYNLKRAGYDVLQAYDGRAGLEMALSNTVDLVLMDLMLPGLDGMIASREIVRAKPWVPVIVVSALREHENLLEGFRVGVDDYVTKPFDLDLLLARIAASLRRVSNADASHLVTREETVLEVGDLRLDSDTRSVLAKTGEASLTPKEHALLRLLLSQPGHLFTREEITEAVWHHRYLSTSRTLDVHMRRLRNKLRSVGADVTVHGIRGVGYRLGPCRFEGSSHA